MLTLPDKSPVESCCMKGKSNGFWETSLNSADIKDQGFALLILFMCLYNLSKLIALRKIWRKSKAWLPSWINGSHIDKRIDSLTADLRMEMRELSEQIIEFQKWSKMKFEEPSKMNAGTCKQCRGRKMPPGSSSNGNGYHPSCIDNELSECNWLQYLHKYVYNPNPRILDTGELENIKRAYSNGFQY